MFGKKISKIVIDLVTFTCGNGTQPQRANRGKSERARQSRFCTGRPITAVYARACEPLLRVIAVRARYQTAFHARRKTKEREQTTQNRPWNSAVALFTRVIRCYGLRRVAKSKHNLHDHHRMTFLPNDTCRNHNGNGVDTFFFQLAFTEITFIISYHCL